MIPVSAIGLWALACLPLPPSVSSFSLADAVASGQVSYTASGNDSSTHYLQPMVLEVTNKTGTELRLRIEPGDGFTPDDPAYQKLIVTKSQPVVLGPKETKKVKVYAMCTEPEDHGQNSTVHYTISNDHSKEAILLARYIASEHLQTIEGQYAVWCITGGRPLEDLAGYDEAAADKLQVFTAGLLHQPVPPKPKEDDYVHNYETGQEHMKHEITGSFEYSYPTTKKISIGLFNKENVVQRELYNEPAATPGLHFIEYGFDASVYTDDVYYLRIIVDDELEKEWEIALNK